MTNRMAFVHGVQTGSDDDATKGPRKMAEALARYVYNRSTFNAVFPAYEDINDETLDTVRSISKLIMKALKSPVPRVFDSLVDLVGDVFIYRNDEKGRVIRDHVRNIIENNPSCILVGHSLGSVVCFDILMEMFSEGLFHNRDKDQWPVRSFISFGSPLALAMFKSDRELIPHGGNAPFHWYNYSDRNDPVISGRIFGSSFEQNNLMRDTYLSADDSTRIHDRVVETGFHLLAHVNYWQQKHIIMRLGQQLS